MKTITSRIIILCVLGFFVAMNTGCALSWWSYRKSHEEIMHQRIIASGDQEAINALRMGISPSNIITAVPLERGAGVKLSIKPGMFESLSKNLGRQIGAAVLDAGTIYALAELTKSRRGDRVNNTDNSVTNNTTNEFSNTGSNSPITVGDNNDITIDNSSES